MRHRYKTVIRLKPKINISKRIGQHGCQLKFKKTENVCYTGVLFNEIVVPPVPRSPK